MLLAPRIRPDAAAVADSADVVVHLLDELRLLGLQRDLGLRPTGPAYVKDENVLASLRTSTEICYFAEMSPQHRRQVQAATTFSLAVLDSLPGAAMAWRASSGWICLTIPTGDVVASVELKPSGLQLGFGITADHGAAYVNTRLGRIVNDPRCIGEWVPAQRTEDADRLRQAVHWYLLGIPAWRELRHL
jgi:hypothetical protein